MILIVDDNDSIREMQVAVLESSNYVVREAADGARALALAEERRPSLVLMDITMPGMTGYQVLARLRELYGTELPIVMVSALPEDEERETAISRGATDFISKPFDIPSVLQCVRQYLQQPEVA
ncbi:two-component system, NtrC family, response regulator PilR [Mariprofundus ferrinatatus]|uniref:Two-component system, NtrC family, response regulator PilR n=1 Tax=Mariprofundus ferrinatatus TaxID=1921087 RepID=A0A2K8LBT9_9PROT|nr:response regulator [Mariprofundus ferrinatatus]ATX82374.1 two-component system, NtrC family, response regulator PilR [Mariprofundus ferrinatatus]